MYEILLQYINLTLDFQKFRQQQADLSKQQKEQLSKSIDFLKFLTSLAQLKYNSKRINSPYLAQLKIIPNEERNHPVDGKKHAVKQAAIRAFKSHLLENVIVNANYPQLYWHYNILLFNFSKNIGERIFKESLNGLSFKVTAESIESIEDIFREYHQEKIKQIFLLKESIEVILKTQEIYNKKNFSRSSIMEEINDWHVKIIAGSILKDRLSQKLQDFLLFGYSKLLKNLLKGLFFSIYENFSLKIDQEELKLLHIYLLQYSIFSGNSLLPPMVAFLSAENDYRCLNNLSVSERASSNQRFLNIFSVLYLMIKNPSQEVLISGLSLSLITYLEQEIAHNPKLAFHYSDILQLVFSTLSIDKMKFYVKLFFKNKFYFAKNDGFSLINKLDKNSDQLLNFYFLSTLNNASTEIDWICNLKDLKSLLVQKAGTLLFHLTILIHFVFMHYEGLLNDNNNVLDAQYQLEDCQLFLSALVNNCSIISERPNDKDCIQKLLINTLGSLSIRITEVETLPIDDRLKLLLKNVYSGVNNYLSAYIAGFWEKTEVLNKPIRLSPGNSPVCKTNNTRPISQKLTTNNLPSVPTSTQSTIAKGHQTSNIPRSSIQLPLSNRASTTNITIHSSQLLAGQSRDSRGSIIARPPSTVRGQRPQSQMFTLWQQREQQSQPANTTSFRGNTKPNPH